jgi:hypothetical protein
MKIKHTYLDEMVNETDVEVLTPEYHWQLLGHREYRG